MFVVGAQAEVGDSVEAGEGRSQGEFVGGVLGEPCYELHWKEK